ncbi:MAG: DUF418 domain-containing protein [Litorimonas sp.]
MGYLEQNAATGRHVFPDLVRAFALMGIVLVNVAYFAWPGPETYAFGEDWSALDHAAVFSVDALFLFKSYSLFSVMFGAGLAYQMMSAERRGTAFGPRYFRRMIGLALIGFLHIAFAFAGDILVIYAVIGSLLFLFRNSSVKALVRWGIGFLVLQFVVVFAGAAAFGAMEAFDPDVAAEVAAKLAATMSGATQVYSSGSFAEVAAFRMREYSDVLAFVAPLQGPGVMAFFLFGLAGVRSGLLQDPDAALWRRARRVYLPLGLVLSGVGAWLMVTSSGFMTARGGLGNAIVTLGAPLSSVGYLGLLAAWSRGSVRGLRLFLARAGTSSLTAYLLQSLILSLVFSGYGLGLFGQIGAAGCVAIGFATGLVSLAFSSLWRMRFQRGPMESLLRGWTYLGRR